jgi:hypothetical protein
MPSEPLVLSLAGPAQLDRGLHGYSLNDGCYYAQLAFDHPALKNGGLRIHKMITGELAPARLIPSAATPRREPRSDRTTMYRRVAASTSSPICSR